MAKFDVKVANSKYSVEANDEQDAWNKANDMHNQAIKVSEQYKQLFTEPDQNVERIKNFGPVLPLMQGMTFNSFDELVGAVAKLHGTDYQQARDAVRAATQQYAQENKGVSTAAELLGGASQLLGFGGALKGAVSAPAKIASWMLGTPELKAGASIPARISALSVPAAVQGGLSAGGASEEETVGGVAGDVAKGAAVDAALSPSIAGIPKIIGTIGSNIMQRVPANVLSDKLRENAARMRLAQVLSRDVNAVQPNADIYAATRSRLTDLGQNAPLAATGRNVLSELDALATMPGAARTLAETEAERISTGRGPTLQAAVTGILKGQSGLPKYQEDLIDLRKQASDPLYDQINNTMVDVDTELQNLLKRGSSAHRLAERTAQVAGRPIDLSKLKPEQVRFINAKDALLNDVRQIITTPASKVRFGDLDKVKQSLFDMATAAKKSGRTNLGSEYDKLRRQFIDKLDQLSPKDQQGNSIYKTARETFAGPSQMLEASDFGKDVYKSGMTIDDIQEVIKDYTPSELDAFKVGAAKALRDKLGTQSGQTELMAFAKNPNTQSKLDLIFGSDAPEFKKLLSQELKIKEIEKVGQGSQSASRLAALTDQAAAAETASDILKTAAAPASIFAKIPNWYSKITMPEQTRNQLAKMLLTRGPEAQQEINALEEYMRKKTSREKAGRMASILAARESPALYRGTME